MGKTPTTEVREVKFRGNTDSEDYNKMQKEIVNDLFNLFDGLSENETLMRQTLDTLMIENQYLERRINKLDNDLTNITPDNKEIISYYFSDHISFGDDLDGYTAIPVNKQAKVNTTYNAVTLSVSDQTSKTYLHNTNTDEIFLPEDLDLNVEDDISSAPIKVEDNDPKNAFDQDITSEWKRKIYTNDDVTEVETTLKVDLPTSIITDMLSNTLYINPFPDSYTDIVEVWYKTVNSSGYKRLSDEGVANFPIINSSNIQLSFTDKPITDLEITFRQQNYIEEDGQRVFVLGAQDINLCYNDYSTAGKVLTNFNLQDRFDDYRINKIININPILSNISNISQAIDLKLYAVEETTNTLREIEVGEVISENYNEDFWIEATLNKVNEVATPILSGLEIEYERI